MENVLLDVHLAEIYSTMGGRDSLHPPGVKNNDSLALYYRSIFAHHNTTEQQFRQSLNWYRDHPDELDSVYSHIMPRLSKLQGQQQARKSTAPVLPPPRLRENRMPGAPEPVKKPEPVRKEP